MKRRHLVAWTTASLLGSTACYSGSLEFGADAGETGADSSTGDGDAGDGDGDDDCDPSVLVIGDSRMPLLTIAEYENVVYDLFGVDADTAAFPGDEKLGPFDVNLSAPPAELTLEAYMSTSETVASQVATNVGEFVDCAGLDDDACSLRFIDEIGLRAYRRPLSQAQRDGLVAVYETGVAQQDFERGIELVVSAMLQSPYFLYHVEIGVPDPEVADTLRLDDYEVASRLSFFLWRSMPDDVLLDAAQMGQLEGQDLEDQVRRMLDDSRARSTIGSMHGQWMEVGDQAPEKSSLAFPLYSESLAIDMQREVEAFASHVVFDGAGTLEAMFTNPTAFVTPQLAEYYGVQIPDGAQAVDGLYEVELPTDQRAGLVTRAGVMAWHGHTNQTAPVHRGRFVRESLMCQLIQDPPPDVDDTPPEVDPDLSVQERFSLHSSAASCKGCHQLMDPIGFSFEHYDGAGQFRTKDGNLDVDASGEIVLGDDMDGTFYGALELSEKLGSSAIVRGCAVRQYFRFGMIRPEAPEDACTVSTLEQEFAASGGDLKELMVSIATHEAFRVRRVKEQG